jgi:hypothetical protein
LLCGNDIGPALTPNLAISYTVNRYGTWAHVACLKNAKQPISTDQNAKIAARTAVQAQSKAKTTTAVSSRPARTTVTTFTAPPAAPTSTLQDVTDALRASIEQEYEARLTAMVNIILAKNDRIATLESDNEKLAMELSKIMVSSVAPTTTHNQKLVQEIKAMGRCGAQKKDGTACRWDTSKTACMHHNKAA